MTQGLNVDARTRFAEDLRYLAPVLSCGQVIDAFAAVPRERFLGPGPWTLIPRVGPRFVSADADPVHLYHDVLVVIDAARDLNNGQPSLWAFLYDRIRPTAGEHVVHVGAGVGYYSAILAEIAGSAGRVTAIEIDVQLAERARTNLAAWPQVRVVQGDGTQTDFGPSDVIVVNAGVTDPAEAWLRSLRPGGRLLLPLTGERGLGAFLKVEKVGDGFAARFVCHTGIFHCQGARDGDGARRLSKAFADCGRELPPVRSLHFGQADGDERCWYQGHGYWLSTALPNHD